MSPKSDLEIFSYGDFDLQALCQQATTLRQGIPCACNPDQHPASGSFNWAVWIVFEDGIQWVFRAPHARPFMPMEFASKLLASEAATLRYVKARSEIPVPEVYHYCASSENPVGIPFILMSEAPGWPLSKVWKPAASPDPPLDHPSKAKVLSQVGSITWKLSRLRFNHIGSLFEQDGSFEVKECLWRGLLLHDRYILDIPRGPFDSESGLYESLISALSEQAESLPLSHHCFVAPVPSREEYESTMQYRSAVDLWCDFVTVGDKIDSANNRLDYIIVADALRDMIRRIEMPTVNPESFPLCHPDLSANNIYVDGNYNITCIIDWAFASTIPEPMLLATPGLPQTRDELSPGLHTPFIEGFMSAIPGSMEESLTRKYRESLRRGQVSWRLTQLLNLDSIGDYHYFATLWRVVNGPDKDLGQYLSQQRRLPHYMRLHHEAQEEDEPPSEIEKEEKDYFGNKSLEHSIAHKLTLMSEWNTQYTNDLPRLRNNMFVATPKLWRWVLQVMQDWKDMP